MGLNILPQKKWNVYNRDNRLKVARDEAAHEQKQQDLNEKHNAAEREHRRLALKERARQRHGGAATINLDALEAAEDEPVVSHRYLQIESRAALPHEIIGGDAADPMLSLETAAAATTTGATNRSLPPSNKRQRREKQPEKSLQQPAPSLAHLASQLDSAPHPQAAAGEATQTEKQVEEPTKLQSFGHFNLFAEEEARAKNPEKTAEQRLLLSKRGDVKTQTMDAHFDESFQLAYGLGAGKNAKAPWYAQNTAATLLGPGSKLESGVGGAETGAAAVMEKWKEDGRAALIAAESGGNDATGDADAEMMLLNGVNVIPKDGKKKKKKKKKSVSSRREDIVDGRRGKEVKKEDQWSKLREERLAREQEEQKRQNEAVRSATLGSSGGGRRPRYNSTYGHGR